MGTVSAVAGAAAALMALVLYLYERRDRPSAVRRMRDEKKQDDLDEFDQALGEQDAKDLTRHFSKLDDSLDPYRVRSEDDDCPG